MNRRSFLGRFAAVAVTPAIPASAVAALLPVVPVLWGDGMHDDAHALEVALNGGNVNWADGRPVGATISNGRFLVGRTVDVTELRRNLIGNHFSRGPA